MVRTALWIGFGLRFAVAVWNGFFGPSFGADLDASTFHMVAANYAKNPYLSEFKFGWIYSYVLGLIYYLTTDSLFLGSLLSCVAWLISAVFLKKIMCLLSVTKSHQFKAMLIYAVLPSSILFTSVTLREPYQLLFINLAIYAALNISLRKSVTHWPVLLFAVVSMGVLHGALLVFGVYILVATLGMPIFFRSKGIPLGRLLAVTPVVVLVVFVGALMFENTLYNLENGLTAGVTSYREGVLSADARSNYKTDVEIDGATGAILLAPISFIQYLFEPMPWRVSNGADVGALLENILRFCLIWRAVTGLRRIPEQRRKPVVFVLVSYLVLEAIWSLGTVNWGTALRHHIPSFGLLLAAAFAYSRTNRRNIAAPVSPKDQGKKTEVIS